MLASNAITTTRKPMLDKMRKDMAGYSRNAEKRSAGLAQKKRSGLSAGGHFVLGTKEYAAPNPSAIG